MEKYSNGTRYKNYSVWNKTYNTPYDYERNGLLKHIMSRKIISGENKMLKTILQYFEKSLIFLMKYIDVLKNFKNFNWKNR